MGVPVALTSDGEVLDEEFVPLLLDEHAPTARTMHKTARTGHSFRLGLSVKSITHGGAGDSVLSKILLPLPAHNRLNQRVRQKRANPSA
jgi:hypothetical protein